MKSIIHIVTNKDLILYTKKIRLSELWSTPLTVVTKQYTWSGGQNIRQKAVHLLSILRSVCPPHPVKQNWPNGRGAPPGRIPTKLSILGITSLYHQSPGFTPQLETLFALKYNCNWLFKTSPAGFPANLRQHTGAWVLQRFLPFFINFYFLELSCETFTLGEVSCFLF